MEKSILWQSRVTGSVYVYGQKKLLWVREKEKLHILPIFYKGVRRKLVNMGKEN